MPSAHRSVQFSQVAGIFIAVFPRSELAGQVTRQFEGQVIPQVMSVLRAMLNEPKTREELHALTGVKDREHLRKAYLEPLLTAGWVERTLPDKPRSRLQKYRLTPKGRARLSPER